MFKERKKTQMNLIQCGVLDRILKQKGKELKKKKQENWNRAWIVVNVAMSPLILASRAQ